MAKKTVALATKDDLNKKADAISYDSSTGKFELLSGTEVLATATIKGGSADTSAIEEALWQGYITADCALSDDSKLVTSDGENILLTKTL